MDSVCHIYYHHFVHYYNILDNTLPKNAHLLDSCNNVLKIIFWLYLLKQPFMEAAMFLLYGTSDVRQIDIENAIPTLLKEYPTHIV